MKGDILRTLIQAHATGDESTFRKAALQLAASESAAGHSRIAEELRGIVAKMPPASARKSGNVVDIAQPRGDLADILDGGHREERLRDIVLREETRELLERIITENRSRSRLEKFGVGPRRRLLFHGPPGCGKTLGAAVLAGEMGLPLMTVRLDALFSRFLGATAVQLRAIFAEMPRRPGVYLFDEFDSVAKARGDAQDVGEMNRVVTAFLQLVDADTSGSLLLAATNHVELLDKAVFRRFDVIVPFEKPSHSQIADLLVLRLAALGLRAEDAAQVAAKAEGWSFADVARASDDAVRSMALAGHDRVSKSDVLTALDGLAQRRFPSGG
jgi:SpoVK/Ycf46/Vps4 family AAA+-type ATPase